MNNLYADAPRLPEGELVDPRVLLGSGGAAIEIEIGPGRGGFAFERLAVSPELRLLGLEIRRKWATIVDSRLRERGLGDRARVFAEDARDALPRFPPACASALFVHFPDPWWKKRHKKRLVVNPELIQEALRVLRPGGELFIQTDVPERARTYEDLVRGESRFEPVGDGHPADNPFLARSPRERRAMRDGLPVHRLLFRRA
jgi:tRNA (guanine-N7-)-methyltransferase